nr:TRAM domain-containing protein [Candidatus Gracilibacteria bacterium]
TGRTPHFKKTEFPGNAELVGKLIDVKITETLTFLLKGEVAN